MTKQRLTRTTISNEIEKSTIFGCFFFSVFLLTMKIFFPFRHVSLPISTKGSHHLYRFLVGLAMAIYPIEKCGIKRSDTMRKPTNKSCKHRKGEVFWLLTESVFSRRYVSMDFRCPLKGPIIANSLRHSKWQRFFWGVWGPYSVPTLHSKDLPLNLGLREDFLEFGFLGSFFFFRWGKSCNVMRDLAVEIGSSWNCGTFGIATPAEIVSKVRWD